MSLKEKIVWVTGASSGIGRAVAQQMAQQGARLILTARRLDRLESLAASLKEKHGTQVYVAQLDMQDQFAVKKTIDLLPESWKAIDILVNNAGLALASEPFQACSLDQWSTMIDTNLKGLLCITHGVVQGMIERNSGHIVNMGSIAGREYYRGGNVYSATKQAVRAISQSLRIDLSGYAIRVSEIAPGAVNTEFSTVRWNDKERADTFYKDFQPLLANDVAEAVLFCVTRPAHVNVSEIVIYPTDQANATTISRKS
jgi:NADP-dependent 3-hydroxy acid dehydrogenase YdfG